MEFNENYIIKIKFVLIYCLILTKNNFKNHGQDSFFVFMKKKMLKFKIVRFFFSSNCCKNLEIEYLY